jgi:hypothetical protein
MDEPHKWERSRYFALLIVSALHLTLVIALLIAAKTRVLLISDPNPIELLVLPPNTAPQTPVPPPAISNRSKQTTPPAVPPSSAITIYPQAAVGENAGAAVDWVQEAQIVAADMAKKSPAERRQESALSASAQSPFALPPAHHKGEQYPTGDGQWIVYVSDDCYQVSKSITSITNATNNGMGLQTYCTRHSKVPRGDLFNQLPAYKTHHPDN